MNSTPAQPMALPSLRSSLVAISLIGAMLLGAALVFGAGFSSASQAHNAAHDMRHANGFPCH